MLLRAAPLALLVLALAACGGSGGGATSTQEKSLLPPGCGTEQVQAIVHAFLARPTVAPPDFFTLYRSSESDGRVFSTKSGPAAVAHLKERLRRGERDRVVQLQVYPVDINHVHVVFTITRLAPDFAKRGIHFRIATGDATIDCAHGNVAGWSQKGP